VTGSSVELIYLKLAVADGNILFREFKETPAAELYGLYQDQANQLFKKA